MKLSKYVFIQYGFYVFRNNYNLRWYRYNNSNDEKPKEISNDKNMYYRKINKDLPFNY